MHTNSDGGIKSSHLEGNHDKVNKTGTWNKNMIYH